MRPLLFILLWVFSVKLNASSLPDFPFVTVTGSSETEVKPDMAVISFSLTVFDKDSDKAYAMLQHSIQKVVSSLQSQNIPDQAITSFEIDKRIRRERDEHYNDLAIVGYELSRSFRVKIQAIESYPAVTRRLHEIDYLSNIESQFDSSKRDEIEVSLIAAAGEDAKKRAELMAKGLGVKLGDVFAFNDSGSFSSFFATFGLDKPDAMMVRRNAPPKQQRIFLPQDILISKTVNVIYKIGD